MTRKNKRRFPADPDRYRDLYGFDSEFQVASERGKAILGAARLDDLLRELIIRHLIRDKEKTNNLLDGPLQSFGNRIAAAHCLGSITERERQNLRQIQDIRNAFAHNLHDVSFEHEWIVDKCESIEFPENSTKPGAEYSSLQRFQMAVMQLDFQLQYRIEEATDCRESPREYTWTVSEDGMAFIVD
jgi:hypothetical protein